MLSISNTTFDYRKWYDKEYTVNAEIERKIARVICLFQWLADNSVQRAK